MTDQQDLAPKDLFMPTAFKEMGFLPWASVEAGAGAAPAAGGSATPFSLPQLEPRP